MSDASASSEDGASQTSGMRMPQTSGNGKRDQPGKGDGKYGKNLVPQTSGKGPPQTSGKGKPHHYGKENDKYEKDGPLRTIGGGSRKLCHADGDVLTCLLNRRQSPGGSQPGKGDGEYGKNVEPHTKGKGPPQTSGKGKPHHYGKENDKYEKDGPLRTIGTGKKYQHLADAQPGKGDGEYGKNVEPQTSGKGKPDHFAKKNDKYKNDGPPRTSGTGKKHQRHGGAQQ